MLTETRAERVDHSAAELRRIERDLHDGAQARLVALRMHLGMAEELVETDPAAARTLLAEAAATTGAALGDLRDVVRGIHPPVLADRGLAGAVRGARPGPGGARSRSPPDLPAGLPAPVESAAYFAVAECLANVGKHAAAEHAWVELAPPRRPAHRAWSATTAGAAPTRRAGTGPAGGRAAAGGVRRHDESVEPVGRTDARHPGGAVQLVLAEDHALLRDGLTRILEAHDLTIRHAVDNAPELEVALADPEVEAAVLDVRLPPTLTDEGLRAAIAVRAARPGFPVLVLSQYVEHLYARELLASGEGGVGYLLKDRVGDVREFVDAVRRVAGGGTVLDPEVVAALMARPRARAVDRLSPREQRGARADGRGPVQRRHRGRGW